MSTSLRSCVAFAGQRMIASGDLLDASVRIKSFLEKNEPVDRLLIFDAITSEPIELDLRGSVREVADRLAKLRTAGENPESGKQGPGRPKLGVVGREVTLLPRHWDWLDAQPGGASVTLRKLVEQAKRSTLGEGQHRIAQEAAYRFMRDMAGDLPGYEEASRVLFSTARDRLKPFQNLIKQWPPDIRAHVLKLFRRTVELEKAAAEG